MIVAATSNQLKTVHALHGFSATNEPIVIYFVFIRLLNKFSWINLLNSFNFFTSYQNEVNRLAVVFVRCDVTSLQ